jgi:hypothetical protein
MNIQVYTAITGNHDPTRDDIEVHTDLVGGRGALHSARWYKMHPHILYPDADWTVWIDGNVFLHVGSEELVSKCNGYDWGAFHHSHRDCVYDEITACLELGLITKRVAEKTRLRHQIWGVPKHLSLGMTMVLVRKNNRANIQRNASWWKNIQRDGYRDQLSFTQVFGYAGLWPAVDFTQPNEYFTRVE